MLKQYSKYKDSGIEWIGPVPKEWVIKRLKFVADINPPRLPGMADEAQCVFIPMEAMNSDGTFDQSCRRPVAEVKTGFTCFAKDDVIFAKITPCFENGKGALLAGLATDVGFGSTEFHVLRMRKGRTVPRFLYYLTVSGAFRRLGEAFMQGVAGQKRVTNDFVCDFVAGIPSPVEQEQIADFLDRKTSQIDDLIAKKQRMIEFLKEERAAVINQAVTKGLDAKVEKKASGMDWAEKIPKHWSIKRLKTICTFVYGDSLANEDRVEGDVPVYGSNGIVGYHNKAITNKPCIVIGRKGSYGKVNFSNTECFPIDTTYFIDHRSAKCHLEWLNYVLPLLELDKFSKDTGVPGLNREDAHNKKVPVPEINIQKEIASYLDRKIGQIDGQVIREQKSIELLKEYRTALISETVTGKIDVRNE